MAFWATGADSAPKRNFRFLISWANPATPTDSQVKWWAKTVTLPSFDVSEVEVHFMDQRHYYPGRVTWNEVSVTLVDPAGADNDATNDLVSLLTSLGYNVADNGAGAKITLDRTGTSILNNFKIEVYGPDDTVTPIETWTLNNAFIKSAKFGDLDYSNDELKQVDLVVVIALSSQCYFVFYGWLFCWFWILWG